MRRESCASTWNPSPKLQALSQVASEMGVVAPVSVRVNPDVDARTHAKILHGQVRQQVSASRSRAPVMSMRWPGTCPGSRLWASTCISAARSPISNRFDNATGSAGRARTRSDGNRAISCIISISAAGSPSPPPPPGIPYKGGRPASPAARAVCARRSRSIRKAWA